MQVKIYTPNSILSKPKVMIVDMMDDLWSARGLSWQLAVRDIRAQYRQTALGLLWVLILPLANTAAWLFIQGAGIVSVQETKLPYPVFVFTGTILWAILMDAVNAPLQQTISAKPMLAKINFPREALILSGIYQTLFNAIIKIAILLVALWALGLTPGWYAVFLPPMLLSLVIAGTVVGLIVTPVGMLYEDVGKGLPLVMQFLMYLTPVVFPLPSEGWSSTLFLLNPFTPLILVSRALITGNEPEMISNFLYINMTMVVLLGVMWVVYRAAMPILIERMSS